MSYVRGLKEGGARDLLFCICCHQPKKKIELSVTPLQVCMPCFVAKLSNRIYCCLRKYLYLSGTRMMSAAFLARSDFNQKLFSIFRELNVEGPLMPSHLEETVRIANEEENEIKKILKGFYRSSRTLADPEVWHPGQTVLESNYANCGTLTEISCYILNYFLHKYVRRESGFSFQIFKMVVRRPHGDHGVCGVYLCPSGSFVPVERSILLIDFPDKERLFVLDAWAAPARCFFQNAEEYLRFLQTPECWDGRYLKFESHLCMKCSPVKSTDLQLWPDGFLLPYIAEIERVLFADLRFSEEF